MKPNNIQIITIFFLIACTLAFAIRDPSSVYCQSLGYKFLIKETELGQQGICVMPNGNQFDSYAFLKGELGTEFSGCSINNLSQKIENDPKICSRIYSDTCTVCIINTTDFITEVEVTKLMEINFKESTCGDNACNPLEENEYLCPIDCPSIQEDKSCNSSFDGQCDPDCTNTDIDCKIINNEKERIQKINQSSSTKIIMSILLIVFIIIILASHENKRRKKNKEQEISVAKTNNATKPQSQENNNIKYK